MTVEDLRNIMWDCYFEIVVLPEEGDRVVYREWKGEWTEELIKKKVYLAGPRIEIIGGQREIVISAFVE